MPEEPVVSQEAQGSYIAQATGGGTATIQVYMSPPSLSDQNRRRFLARLRTRYRDLLEQSLQGAVRIMLELEGCPDAVTPPVQLLYLPSQHAAHQLPTGTSLAQIYEGTGHELLLLGEPGAGKSTLLLELALEVVERAEREPNVLLPVIVPLSTWAQKRHSVEQWFIEQVALLYEISTHLSERWVREERLFPLLDGLDEMEEEARIACIEAINTYHHEHLHPLVVASRKAEYEAAATHARLTLHSAVVVQPITVEQVDTYLAQQSEAVSALRIALQEHLILQEVVTTPLMLSILILTYQGKAMNDLPIMDSSSEQQRQIFARYVVCMIERKKKLLYSSPQALVSRLRWLALQMRAHDQTIFYLEHLQPDWLTSAQQCTYMWLAVRLPALLIGILASLIISPIFHSTYSVFLLQSATLGGLLGWLFSRPRSRRRGLPTLTEDHHRQEHWQRFGRGLLLGIVTGLLIGLSFEWNPWYRYWLGFDGLIYGIVIGIGSLGLSLVLPSETSATSLPLRTQRRWQFLIHRNQTIHGQRAWLVFALLATSYVLSDKLSYLGLSDGLILAFGYTLKNALSDGLLHGLIFVIISVLVSLILKVQTEGIVLTERLHWTWHSLMRSLFTLKHMKETLLVAGGIGLLAFLLYWLEFGTYWGEHYGISYGLSYGLLYWILLGLFQGVESSRIKDHTRHHPNQGVQHSLRNGGLLALISSGIIYVISVSSTVLFYGLSYGLSWDLNEVLIGRQGMVMNEWLSTDLIIAVSGGLLVFASRGGLAVLRHYIIRLLLVRSHTFPLQAPQFLEEAINRILLQRVGGGYSFTHRLLLDYFADLPDETP